MLNGISGYVANLRHREYQSTTNDTRSACHRLLSHLQPSDLNFQLPSPIEVELNVDGERGRQPTACMSAISDFLLVLTLP